MPIEKSIDYLSHVTQFADFLELIKEERESCISALFNAETEKVQQIAGQVLAYDQIMKVADAETILSRHRDKAN
jgi:hypothetical protein|tara:strand:- start:452 stop:673 length:222 start_codon:yes stop_codon:yes gene_type:complete